MRTRTKTIDKQFSIKFDNNTRDKIIELSKKQNISQGEFVRLAVKYYLDYLEVVKENEELFNDLLDINN